MARMSTRTIWTLVLLASLSVGAMAQRGDKEIKKREQELQQLRTDIQAFEQKLKESERREQSTLDRLDDLERQSGLLQQLVRKLREEEVQLTAEIDTARTGIVELERRIQFLQSHYANYVRSVYKNGRVYDLELLFSSKSINQLSIRIQYLRKFSEQRAKDLQGIVDSKASLEQKNVELQVTLASERKLLADKTREESTLNRKYAERQTVLKRIRRDKKQYQKELTRKTAAVQQIEQMIADLIEKERIRKEQEAAERRERELAEARERERTKSAPPTPVPTAVAGSAFTERRGKLRWPVSSGSVKSKFGNQIHPVLKTLTQNSGIDIATPAGSDVYAVADGEVSIVSFLPGFGNFIIVNHFNGFHTVYAHLSEVLVSKSQRIREGAVIARSGETVDQPLLHFEVWKEREKQDPEVWLTARK
jgi:septal ring factor EnvC (AmiA/AmiB activator)